jgi:Tol biopolymer transport system component
VQQQGAHSQRSSGAPSKAFAVAAAAFLALALLTVSSKPANAREPAPVGKRPRSGMPKLGAVVPERLPPFIAYDHVGPGNSGGFVFGIFLMRPDGSDSHAIGSLPAYALEPSWSPAGTRILFTTGCVVRVASADGSNQRAVIPAHVPAGYQCSDSLEDPRWSPTGRRIVYTTAEIHIAKVDGSHDHPVPHTEGGNNASFSPDGRYLVFDRSNSRNGFKSHIYVIRTNGTGLRPITHGQGEVDPSWSPSGSRVIYACSFKHGAVGHITVFAPTAVCGISRGHPTPRTLYSDPFGFISTPRWSADGHSILLTFDTGGGAQVGLLGPSGGEPVAITPPGISQDPDW